MSFDPQNTIPFGAKIKVIGVGGGGGNAVNTMVRTKLEGVEIVACNTDIQSLRFSLAPAKIQIGKELTRGLGAGADPDIGRDAAVEDRQELENALAGADMVFITAGMGGGTGTGAAAVIAQIARELGALTVAVVTKPFSFEGKRRRSYAETGVARLRESVDSLITIPNQRLLQVASPELSMLDAFKLADEVLVNAVRGISDIINIPGTVNVDFADVKTIMSCTGQALMGIGIARGEGRAGAAARSAISSPLLEDIDIEGATGILINITAGAGITLAEVNEACSIIQEAAHEDATIIFGAVIDETLDNQIRVTVIATGFPVEQDAALSSEPRRKAAEAHPKPVAVQAPLHPKNVERAVTGSKAPSAPPPNVAAGTPPFQPEPPSPVLAFGGLNEAAELARLTLSPLGAGNLEVAPAFSMAVRLESESAVATLPPPAIDFPESPISPPEMESSLITANDAVASSAPRIEGATAFADIEEPIVESSPISTDVKPQQTPDPALGGDLWAAMDQGFEGEPFTAEPVAEAPLDSFFADEMQFIDTIDRKIDEALGLAERAKHPGKAEDEADDLEIPAFLRSSTKNLPLD